jgi:hypothetical protein
MMKRRCNDHSKMHLNTLGFDTGNAKQQLAVPLGRAPQFVQTLDSFEADLHRLVRRLKVYCIEAVAMQAVGGHWSAVEILRATAFRLMT